MPPIYYITCPDPALQDDILGTRFGRSILPMLVEFYDIRRIDILPDDNIVN